MQVKIFFFVLTACLATLFTGAQTNSSEVRNAGRLSDIFMEGDIKAKVGIDSLQKSPHLYALGALDKMQGEIIVLDGRVFTGKVINHKSVVDSGTGQEAALLVYSYVQDWKEFEIPDTVITFTQLEEYLPKLAGANGIDTAKPFPFLITGKPLTVKWHIINWTGEKEGLTHEKLKELGISGNSFGKSLEILGFFSFSHQRIWTHGDSFMHLHILTENNKVAAHLDDLIIQKGVKVKLPL